MGSKGQDMKELMREWISERPGRDIPMLAKRAALEYNTVRRIYNGGNPDCQTALALLNRIATKQKAMEYLRSHFPQAAEFHEKEFTTETFYSNAEDLRPVIEDLTTFVVLNLSYAGLATRQKISEEFGNLGLLAAKELVETEKAYWNEEDRLVSTRAERFFSYESKYDLIKVCKHILKLSRNKGGFPVAFMGALTDEELATAKQIETACCLALKELFLKSQGGTNMVGVANIFVTLFGDGEDN
jgi:hypothetical protein